MVSSNRTNVCSEYCLIYFAARNRIRVTEVRKPYFPDCYGFFCIVPIPLNQLVERG